MYCFLSPDFDRFERRNLKVAKMLAWMWRLLKITEISNIAKSLTAVLFAALLIGGCSNTQTLTSSLGLNSDKKVTEVKAVNHSQKTVAFTSLVGVPDDISTKMLTRMKAASRARSLKVTEEITTANLLVRGYLVATPQADGAKLFYIWDVNNRQGVRIHRVLGNEMIKGKGATKNGWALVNDTVIAKLANTSADKLSLWIKGQTKSTPLKEQKIRENSTPKNIGPVAKRETGTPGDPIVTGAVSKQPQALFTHVNPVQGAPGDGRISLTNALRRELTKSGVKLSHKKVPGAYSVQGAVKLDGAEAGKQKVNIIWKVYDAKGVRVGTVSQNNVVPAGSLNGAWGPSAEAAASAAAKGIAKLLPGKK